ncbi:MAG: hydrogenase maturation nickel metallochaperone HypA [Nanoarchaeota archaeon]|nr:hydrogenase maturation nickel metallochaperone HypA [Nanoarchaeota archaeon]MBU1103149.1 hydrogenase maturation nickel metallochaperone HypA [Nanoarchaeota archaeon]
MHEIAVANRIIEEAKRQKEDVRALKVEVGELAEISAKEVEEALKQMVDWEVEVGFVESKIKCSCGFEGRARIVDRGHGYCVFNCPDCGASGKSMSVLEGGEIKIVGVG